MNRNVAPKVGPGAVFEVDTSGGQYLEEHSGRDFLAIVNNGTVSITVGFGVNPATEGAASLPIAAGAMFNPPVPPADAIWLAAASDTASVTVFEG
jgi:hypothetical protein